LFDAHTDQAVAAGLPAHWPALRGYYSRIRKAGHYLSSGELETNLAALAAPLHYADASVAGALSVVTTVPRMAVIDVPKLAQIVMRAAKDISARMP
jgi:DNA-binding IclR family transcriptional regulator